MELMDEDTRWDDQPPLEPERTPPWSEEAEQSVLGAILLENGALALVGDILTPRSFYARRHQLIFAALQAQIAASLPADPVTVHESLAPHHEAEEYGGLAYLTALAHVVPSARNCRRYAELVMERASERDAIAAAEEVARRFADGPPLAFDIMKSVFARGLDAMIQAEVDLQPILWLSEDHREGKAAVKARRRPNFSGR